MGLLRTALSILVWVPILFGAVQAANEEGETTGYRMGPGDKISIKVFGENDLTLDAQVGESGLISYPFLGELEAKGKTQLELEREINSKLKDGYLVNPEVTVVITQYRKFFLDGHVNKRGGYEYQPGMTVRKAITAAGGFGPRADRDDITVVRGGNEPGSEGPKKPVPIGLDDPIYPGDVITVDRSFF